MAEEFKKTGLMDGMGESDNAPEDDGGSAKYSLPFGLCKKYGIPIGKNWTPRDAWAALKGKGVVSDVSGEYDELDKTGEQGNETQDGTNPQEEVKTNGDVVKFSTREEAVRYIQDKVGMNISQGMSKIPDDVFIPNAERLANLEKKFGIIGKQPNKVDFDTVAKGSTVARCRYTLFRGKLEALSINPMFFDDKQLSIAFTESDVESGWSMPCAPEYLGVYNITHEYGHMVFQNIIYDDSLRAEMDEIFQRALKDSSRNTDMYVSELEKARKNRESGIIENIIEIAKERNKNFVADSFMSRYGKKETSEWLAEAFANSQCGEPNEIGEATMEYLKRRGVI